MKTTNILAGVCSLMLAGVALSAWGAAVSLPVSEGFEGSTGAGWSTNDAGVTYPADTPLVGDNYLSMTNDDGVATLTLDVSGSPSNVWWRGFAKVTLYEADSEPSSTDLAGSAAAFYVNASSNIVMVNGASAWVTNLTQLSNPTSSWVGYAVHLDYVADKWDLYVDTTGTTNGTLEQWNSSALDFYTANSGFTQLVVKGETRLDAFNVFAGYGSVGTASPATVAFGNRTGATNQWYVSHVAEKTYSGGGSNLVGQLGSDLASGLGEGDKIQFFISGDWHQYELTDGEWDAQGGAENPATFYPAAGTVFWIQYATARDEFTVFDPNWLPATLETNVILTSSSTIGLKEGHAENGAGWTAVRWTVDKTKSINSIGLEDVELALESGTEVFVILADSPTFKRAIWDGSKFVPRPVAANAPQVSRNAVIWIKRSASDTAEKTWTVNPN
jgi:hypothetical protein